MVKQLRKVIPHLLVAVVLACFSAFLEAIVTLKLSNLCDLALGKDLDGIKKQILPLVSLAIILVPVKILVSVASSWYRKAGEKLIKSYYIKGVFQKDIAQFQRENTAKYISSITNDCDAIKTNFIDGIYNCVNALTFFISGVVIIANIKPVLIFPTLGIISLNILIVNLTSKPLNKLFKERSDMFEKYTSYIKEVLSAFHIIKSNDLEDRITKDYYEKSMAIQKKGYQIEKKYTEINTTQNSLTTICFRLINCFVGFLVILGKTTMGGFIAVMQGIDKMAWPLFEFFEAVPKIFSVKELIKKLDKSLENSDDYVETIDEPSFMNEIKLENVSFKYEDGEEFILKDVNVSFKKNGKYLIVGPSGGGKSTLLKLLRKYYAPTGGKLTMDGVNIKDIKKEEYFKLIGNIEQYVFIFEDTIKNNLTLYKEYTDEEISEALQKAGLAEFISGLKEGLETIIVDNGKNISGGERSRLVIARALLQKTDILFMDEAFASLDMDRAKEIEKTILELTDITVINVSHVIFEDTKSLYDGVYNVKTQVKPLGV